MPCKSFPALGRRPHVSFSDWSNGRDGSSASGQNSRFFDNRVNGFLNIITLYIPCQTP